MGIHVAAAIGVMAAPTRRGCAFFGVSSRVRLPASSRCGILDSLVDPWQSWIRASCPYRCRGARAPEAIVNSADTRDALSGMLAVGKFEPYIRYIRFPRFRNLRDGTRIDFGYPVTALVGPNGTNKTAILRAV